MEFEIDHIIDDIIDTIVSDYKDCSKCGQSKLRSTVAKATCDADYSKSSKAFIGCTYKF